MRVIIVIICVFKVILSEEEKVFKVAGLDSYLEAYREVQSESVNDVEKSDNGFSDFGGYPYPAPPQNQYGPPMSQYVH